MEQTAQGVLAVLVANRYGVLTRVSSLFGRKGFNIRSISAGETTDPTRTRITIVAQGTPFQFEQMRLQLEKLEDVLKVELIAQEMLVQRELLMLKTAEKSGEFPQLAASYGAVKLDCRNGVGVWSVMGAPSALDELLQKAGSAVLESCRTGVTAMEMGSHTL